MSWGLAGTLKTLSLTFESMVDQQLLEAPVFHLHDRLEVLGNHLLLNNESDLWLSPRSQVVVAA
jgi:hypothetical protein